MSKAPQQASQGNATKDRHGTLIKPLDLSQFLRDQELHPGQWDLLLFGDGSGQQWSSGGGFCAFLVDTRRQLRAHIVGARSHTTVNRMELGAYVEALSFHYNYLLENRLERPPYRVWIFSDSEYVVKCGSRVYERKANRDLWVSLDWYETRGYQLRWRWIPRNSTPLHAMADRLAGRARLALKEIPLTDGELYALMPATNYAADELKDITITLDECPSCGTPMGKREETCPQCGSCRTTPGNSE